MKISFHLTTDEAAALATALEALAPQHPTTGTALTYRLLSDLAGQVRHELARTGATLPRGAGRKP